MKLLIISPLNELSGSCVVIKDTITHLPSYCGEDVNIQLCAPTGAYLNPDIILPSGLFSSILFIMRNRKLISSFDKVVVYTLRGVLLSLVIDGPYLYVHELNTKAKVKYYICNAIINIFNIKTYSVCPEICNKYSASILLPNFYLNKFEKDHKKNDKQVLMIANFSVEKGVYKLLSLAKDNADYKFVLLTQFTEDNKHLKDDFIQSLPANLKVFTRQDIKCELLARSKYIINLSLLDESFGLVFFEGARFNCIPISFEQAGSRYLLGDVLFLNSDMLNFASVIGSAQFQFSHKPLNSIFEKRFDPSSFYKEFI